MLLKILIVLIYSVFTLKCHAKIVEERRGKRLNSTFRIEYRMPVILNTDHCVSAKLPLRSWEIKPYPFVVHVWNIRFNEEEKSCIGIVAKNDTILIPNWCIRAGDGEKRGHISIYAPKSSELMTHFSRSKRDDRYDERFDLIFISDDVRDILAPNETFASNIPNTEVLKLPISVPSHLKPICFWPQGNPYGGNNTLQIFLAWRQVKDYILLIQQKSSRPINKGESIESFKAKYTQASEVMLSVDFDNDNALILSSFLLKN